MQNLECLDKETYEAAREKTCLLENLRWAYIIPGDIVWIPFGSIMVEKVVGSSHALCLRVPSTFICDDCFSTSMFYASAYPRMLSLVLTIILIYSQ